MKTKLGIIVGIITAALLLSPAANAQAPSSIAGDGFLVGITSGTSPLASYGYYVFLTANSGNTYQTIGVYAVTDSVGTYSWSMTSSTTGQLNINDTTDGYTLLGSASFSSANSGGFNVSTVAPVSGYYQNGNFIFASSSAPASLTGKTVVCTISDGLTPFAYTGSFSLQFATSGNTYTVVGDGVHTGGSTGTYSYSLANRSTGKVQINDSLGGAFTVYLGVGDPAHGSYAIVRSAGGFQIGDFVILDTTPPIVSISSPSAQTYSTSRTVTITATASDNIGVTQVDFYDGSTLKGSSSTSPFSYEWDFTAADNGAHIWTARAYDAAGNSTLSSSVTLTTSIDATPPTVTIISPTNGKIVNAASVAVSGTATDPSSPTSGVGGVEVRLNGGSWVNATGTTSWNKTVNLLLGDNSIEARSRDNTGNYSLVSSIFVSFVDTNKPTATITSPTVNQRWSNSVFTVTGTASDNVQVTNISYQLNSAGWNPGTTGNNWSNWTAGVNLTPGTNIIQAYASDAAGNYSPTGSVSFVYVVTNQLSVMTNGQGTISPYPNNAWLEIGRRYTNTAAAINGHKFLNWVIATNWIGGVTNTNASLAFLMQSNLTLTVNFADTNKPVLSITNLVTGQRWSNAVFTVRGKASDNWLVSNVWYQLNSAGWSNAVTANGWTNWSAALNLIPGTNLLQAYAEDSTGNQSATTNVSFVYVVTNRLSVMTNGQGTISPYPNNAWLEIGRNYTNTATAINGHKFASWIVATNWIGGVTNTNAACVFLMQSNLTLTVNFADTNKPTLSLTNPVANSRFAVPAKKVQGTASDNVRVAGVFYQLNTNVWTLAGTTNGYTNWASTIALITGTNTVKAYAVDPTGNYSTTSSVSFYCSNAFVMSLSATQSVASGGLGLNLTVSTGMTCRIDVSTNLLDWSTLTNFTSTNTTMQFRDTAATNNPKRFYRGVVP